jgi:hypothetical protein
MFISVIQDTFVFYLKLTPTPKGAVFRLRYYTLIKTFFLYKIKATPQISNI